MHAVSFLPRALPPSVVLAVACLAGGCQPEPLRQPPPPPPAPPAPPPPPPRFVAHHRHDLATRCGKSCIYVREAFSELGLELRPNGVAAVWNRGSEAETFRSVAGTTRHDTNWKRAWNGSWTNAGRRMVLELEPAELECTRRAGAGQDERPCEPVRLVLDCTRGAVWLEGQDAGRARSWICRPRTAPPRETIATFPWVFGLEQLVEANDSGSIHAPERAYRVPARDKAKKKKDRR
jgi:hypothetical protein